MALADFISHLRRFIAPSVYTIILAAALIFVAALS